MVVYGVQALKNYQNRSGTQTRAVRFFSDDFSDSLLNHVDGLNRVDQIAWRKPEEAFEEVLPDLNLLRSLHNQIRVQELLRLRRQVFNCFV